MTQYETMVLLSPDLTEEAVEERITAFEGQITEGGGSVLNVDRWGKKRLAYPIRHQRHGYYFVITYQAESATVREIERQLRLREDTWRYMTVRMDPNLLRKLEKNAKRASARSSQDERRDSSSRDRDSDGEHGGRGRRHRDE